MSEATYHVLADIEAERFRQMSAEGWTVAHDDQHYTGDLARAAAAYAYEAGRTDQQRADSAGDAPQIWPWSEGWWKPTDRRRDLIKAAALIVAEIERLDRAHTIPSEANEMEKGEQASIGPCGIADPSTRDCPNMKEVGGGMDGERYRCAVCGKGYFLDYEEMK